ncbi:hypothetical protein IMG5_087920 [Ichthyophthirius multifiliis]|uniref:Uncharacterized protein n=1 Tax=Ichthyophthirius multifiliis TaxID=5932 RepID=G0QR28_ICHMU|nr:hypothetical protein IMG5_087920 [Ichthyophthirius multifiliis]EGR32329.1 hypothetical protein IMG5_087920 [Ichthyophthirius multifiliis]|eukprot:XP_004035815.1 hypothetical protein IMG5_087920 [Ichthyophthirius multifiliis]
MTQFTTLRQEIRNWTLQSDDKRVAPLDIYSQQQCEQQSIQKDIPLLGQISTQNDSKKIEYFKKALQFGMEAFSIAQDDLIEDAFDEKSVSQSSQMLPQNQSSNKSIRVPHFIGSKSFYKDPFLGLVGNFEDEDDIISIQKSRKPSTILSQQIQINQNNENPYNEIPFQNNCIPPPPHSFQNSIIPPPPDPIVAIPSSLSKNMDVSNLDSKLPTSIPPPPLIKLNQEVSLTSESQHQQALKNKEIPEKEHAEEQEKPIQFQKPKAPLSVQDELKRIHQQKMGLVQQLNEEEPKNDNTNQKTTDALNEKMNEERNTNKLGSIIPIYARKSQNIFIDSDEEDDDGSKKLFSRQQSNKFDINMLISKKTVFQNNANEDQDSPQEKKVKFVDQIKNETAAQEPVNDGQSKGKDSLSQPVPSQGNPVQVVPIIQKQQSSKKRLTKLFDDDDEEDPFETARKIGSQYKRQIIAPVIQQNERKKGKKGLFDDSDEDDEIVPKSDKQNALQPKGILRAQNTTGNIGGVDKKKIVGSLFNDDDDEEEDQFKKKQSNVPIVKIDSSVVGKSQRNNSVKQIFEDSDEDVDSKIKNSQDEKEQKRQEELKKEKEENERKLKQQKNKKKNQNNNNKKKNKKENQNNNNKKKNKKENQNNNNKKKNKKENQNNNNKKNKKYNKKDSSSNVPVIPQRVAVFKKRNLIEDSSENDDSNEESTPKQNPQKSPQMPHLPVTKPPIEVQNNDKKILPQTIQKYSKILKYELECDIKSKFTEFRKQRRMLMGMTPPSLRYKQEDEKKKVNEEVEEEEEDKDQIQKQTERSAPPLKKRKPRTIIPFHDEKSNKQTNFLNQEYDLPLQVQQREINIQPKIPQNQEIKPIQPPTQQQQKQIQAQLPKINDKPSKKNISFSSDEDDKPLITTKQQQQNNLSDIKKEVEEIKPIQPVSQNPLGRPSNPLSRISEQPKVALPKISENPLQNNKDQKKKKVIFGDESEDEQNNFAQKMPQKQSVVPPPVVRSNLPSLSSQGGPSKKKKGLFDDDDDDEQEVKQVKNQQRTQSKITLFGGSSDENDDFAIKPNRGNSKIINNNNNNNILKPVSRTGTIKSLFDDDDEDDKGNNLLNKQNNDLISGRNTKSIGSNNNNNNTQKQKKRTLFDDDD